jgi:hypothetical protein
MNATTTSITAGSRVRFRDGIKPACAGIVFVVAGEPHPDNAVSPSRAYVWLVRAEDAGKPPSRQRQRSGYLDELEPVSDRWGRTGSERFETVMGDGSRLVVKSAPLTARTDLGTALSWHFAWYASNGGVIHGFSRAELFNAETGAMRAAVSYFRRVLA